MPNWCENRLIVRGDAGIVKDFLTRSTVEGKFSLSGLVPIPPELNITSGSNVDNGRDIINAEKGDWSGVDQKLSWPAWTKDIISESDSLQEKRNKMLESMKSRLSEKDMQQAIQSFENEKKYGCKDWYTWSVNNWGTKWDVEAKVDELDAEELEIIFDSAWAPPIAWLEQVEEIYQDKDIRFQLHYDEPGMGFKGVYSGGSDQSILY